MRLLPLAQVAGCRRIRSQSRPQLSVSTRVDEVCSLLARYITPMRIPRHLAFALLAEGGVIDPAAVNREAQR